MPQRIDQPDVLPRGRRGGAADEQIEVRRYLDVLHRSRFLIAGIVAVLTIVVVLVSASLPDRYTATTSIVKNVTTDPFTAADVDSVTRELATVGQLLTTNDVLTAAAAKVPGESADTLEQKVESTVDPEANLVFVTATDGDPQRSAEIANAVAETFVEEQRQVSRRQFEAARASLQQELDRVTAQGGNQEQAAALRQRISELGVALASSGNDLTVAQRAEPPSERSSPKPVRNGLLALFVGLFVGVLVALGRDQLVPRVSGQRELSRLLDLQVLAAVPHVQRRFGLRPQVLSGIEYETYQSLGASVRFALPPDDEPRIILVTSALHAEGKSTVTFRLGRALAQAGNRTLLVSADLRWPTLHDLAETQVEPGLTDLLLAAEETGRSDVRRMLPELIVAVPHRARGGALHVLPSGGKVPDPAQLLGGPGVESVFDELLELDYAYVLVDSAPILGIADSQALARRVRRLLFVARLDRLTLETVYDARDVLDRYELEPLGMVVVGARGEASPYYLTAAKPASVEGA
jgi:capsular polysaccharide biosynthesis protein/MinD-like ATPase involved in chromosome partitioning or flagellar assembly